MEVDGAKELAIFGWLKIDLELPEIFEGLQLVHNENLA